MKKPIFTLALATTLMAGTIFTGCQSSDANVKSAKSDMKDSKEELATVKKNADDDARRNDWKIFKKESEVKIRENEVSIAELRENMKTTGRTTDTVLSKRIDEMEQRNKDMRSKIDTYDKNQSNSNTNTNTNANWESFKREFNNDMNSLGKSLKDFTVDNKK